MTSAQAIGAAKAPEETETETEAEAEDLGTNGQCSHGERGGR